MSELYKVSNSQTDIPSEPNKVIEPIMHLTESTLEHFLQKEIFDTTDRLSGDNLRQEGVPEERIRFVGNIMIDTLEAQREKALKLDPEAIVRSAFT